MTASSDWLDQARRLLDAFVQEQSASGAAGRSGSAAHGTDCSWCPLCQAAAVVRGERPELAAALADVLTATATALRAFAETPPPTGPASPAAPEEGPAAEPPPVAQRIEIT